MATRIPLSTPKHRVQMEINNVDDGIPDSAREKTEEWLHEHLYEFDPRQLRMRMIGDNAPDDMMKERWLLEHRAMDGRPIEYVYDDRPKVVRMWRRHGIFVFNCAQNDKEF